MQVHLLGRIDFQVALDLQLRLIPQIAARDDGQVTLLLCEHTPLITIGRTGSPEDVATHNALVRTGQIATRWVNRGGGSLMHCPGQLAIYPLVPLRQHRLSVGEFLSRLQTALAETLDDLRLSGLTQEGRYGLWGRTGQLAALGVAVRQGVSYYGAYLNVDPPMGLFRLVQSDPHGQSHVSCLVAERRGPLRMPTVRTALIERLAASMGSDRWHLFTGHPMLRRATPGRPTN